MKKKRLIGKIIYHVLVCGLGLVMIYPLVWMIMSSFKPTSTIFTTAGQLIPTQFVFENYVNGWKGFAKITFATFFKNSLFISIVATMGTLISSSLVAFGLSRCKFFGRRALFVAMLLSTGDVITTVGSNPDAIGYASLASVKDTVKALTVGGVAPSEATVKDGSYVVQRPFVLVTKDGTKLSDSAQKFFDYITSDAASQIISKAGAVPVK